ncbi:hypothetical protein M9Y22_21330, partial [Escherichia coli]|nr:hypothetical protein [Escherichia coli]
STSIIGSTEGDVESCPARCHAAVLFYVYLVALCLIKTFITLMWVTQKRKCRRKLFANIEGLLLGAQQLCAPLMCAM